MYASTKIFCKTLVNKKCIPVHLSPETRRKFRRKLNGKMGMIHTEDTRKTLAEIAAENGWKYDTLWRKAKRVFPAESWTAETPVPASVADALLSSDRRKKPAQTKRPARNPKQQPASVHQPPAPASGVSTPAPGRAKMAWPTLHEVRRFLISALLFCAVVLHGGLIWYECSVLWGVPGQIGGGAVFSIVFAALLLASDDTLPRTSGNALAFMFFVDFAAWKVHYDVFKTPVVENYITASLCAFICASSFVALWLFRDSKLD